MGILFNEVKYYRSTDINFSDPSLNGGDVGDEIINDTMHSIFPEISASQRESGVIIRAKIFIANESTGRKMQDCIFYIKQDVQPEDRLRMYEASTQITHEDDEDFTTLRKYVNSPVKNSLSSGMTEIDIPSIDKPMFLVGDPIVVVDGYFRAVYRGEVSDIQDHPTDTTSARITLSSPYSSTVVIPAQGGYVGNGPKLTLSPSDVQSLWLELTVSPTNAIDAEIINQFQVGTHFDDVVE